MVFFFLFGKMLFVNMLVLVSGWTPTPDLSLPLSYFYQQANLISPLHSGCDHVCSYQVSASLDALIEISSGKVNIHVLMAMAAFASIFMGNSLEGGLLLAMFNLAHIGELMMQLTHLLN